MMANLSEAAIKTANFVELATPSGAAVARQIRELVACDEPLSEIEKRLRLSVIVARLATAGALALALVQQHGLALVDADYAAGELADAGIPMSKAALGDAGIFGCADPHALISSLLAEGNRQ